jgi:hypothetical protein
MLYLQILEGPSAEKARPILATTDRGLISHVASAISERLSPTTEVRKIISGAFKSNKPQVRPEV